MKTINNNINNVSFNWYMNVKNWFVVIVFVYKRTHRPAYINGRNNDG